MPPSRLQKRWSRALRTGGALLGILGAAALADFLLGLVDPAPARTPADVATAPLWAGLAFLAAGALAFALGRRWR